jgi:hypothetical protein
MFRAFTFLPEFTSSQAETCWLIAMATKSSEWESVVKVGSTTTKGGDAFAKCIHCDKQFVGELSALGLICSI